MAEIDGPELNATDPGDLEAKPQILPDPAPEAAEVQAKPQKPIPRRGGLVGGILGGAIAAAAGFGVAQYVPDGWPLADTTALQAALTAQQTETAALKAQLADLAQKPAVDPALQDRVAALETRPSQLADLDARIVALETKLAAIEALPLADGAVSAATVAAQDSAIKLLQGQIQALQTAGPADVAALNAEAEARLKEAEAMAAAMKADAENIAKMGEARAAVGRLQAALDIGAPYANLLPVLGDVPAVLTDNAETGLPTLAALQAAYPAAARMALEAALRANMGESWTERATSFLRSQTGARSLTPQEGNDPDAILSRSEAALGTGDIAAALTEIAALPTEAQAAMADWRALAEKRLAGVEAVAALAATLGE
jgi:hypothetical protein